MVHRTLYYNIRERGTVITTAALQQRAVVAMDGA